MHSTIDPAILYWGTPVVIVSSLNEDGTSNVAAISSAFWLGHRCILGFASYSKTPKNILRTGHCVVNLPDDSMEKYVNNLALTTGSDPVPEGKLSMGYRSVKDKWATTGLSPQESETVASPRVKECPVQMECTLAMSHPLMQDNVMAAGSLVAIELRVLRVHVLDTLRLSGHPNRVDPDKWRPLIMSFQKLYGLQERQVGSSKLSIIDEESYRPLAMVDVALNNGGTKGEESLETTQASRSN